MINDIPQQAKEAADEILSGYTPRPLSEVEIHALIESAYVIGYGNAMRHSCHEKECTLRKPYLQGVGCNEAIFDEMTEEAAKELIGILEATQQSCKEYSDLCKEIQNITLSDEQMSAFDNLCSPNIEDNERALKKLSIERLKDIEHGE